MGKKRLIVDIEFLSTNHSCEEIIRFLKDYVRDQEKALVIGIKDNRGINGIVNVLVRLYIAIMTLEKEVNKIVRFEQRTGSGRHVHERNRRRHFSPGSRQDKNHDGKDRDAGQDVRRVA